jgi:hypothetical protein
VADKLTNEITLIAMTTKAYADKSVLAVGGLPVLGDLLRGGLADVNNRQSVEMPGLDLRGK